MSEVKNGDVVKVHYTGKIQAGEQFDSSVGKEPLGFTVGAGQMIKGFDTGVVGMKVGDKKTVVINAEDGYGVRSEEAMIEFPKENIPAEMKLEIGMNLTLQDQEGRPFPVTVTEIKEGAVVLDANHFLAGKTLEFDIEMVSIN